MFIDFVEIKVRGGKGGNGLISFRHEKFVPFGGPSGGDGGNGGSVILIADSRVRMLSWFKGRGLIAAKNGGPGGNNKKTGKKGEDSLVLVPVGTVVYEKTIKEKILIADMEKMGQRIVVARGGRSGRGNVHFATPTYQAPEIAEPGMPGEERELILELKLIADVGIIGRPNAGKSTLLNTATRSSTKIASYPFTTTEPVLGVVDVGWQRFILAEIPGLVEGAHLGRGLGRDFLRHAERTRLFLHLIDGSSPHLAEDWAEVNKEILLYNAEMAVKSQIVVVNKIDIPSVRERLPQIRKQFKRVTSPLYFISAATGEGVAELMSYVSTRLEALKAEQNTEKLPLVVFRPRPVDNVRSSPGKDRE